MDGLGWFLVALGRSLERFALGTPPSPPEHLVNVAVRFRLGILLAVSLFAGARCWRFPLHRAFRNVAAGRAQWLGSIESSWNVVE